MGAMADSMAAYAQILLDDSDGSFKQLKTAYTMAQMCWTLALLPEPEQEEMLTELRPSLNMDDATFANFRETIIAPMILRHHAMFPNMPRLGSKPTTPPLLPEKKFAGTGRNQPCPCNSGKKYKRCCGQ